MIVFHLAVRCGEGYLDKRGPLSEAHHRQLEAWRTAGIVIGAGSAPDGRTADLVCRLAQPTQLRQLWDDDQFVRAGLWTSYTARSFTEFVEPWELPPLNAARRATIVEGTTAEHDMAQFALIELRGAGRMAFGGFFEGGTTFTLCRTADAAEAIGWLKETGFWSPESLAARPLAWEL